MIGLDGRLDVEGEGEQASKDNFQDLSCRTVKMHEVGKDWIKGTVLYMFYLR